MGGPIGTGRIPHEDVAAWIDLHGASGYDWHTTGTGQTVLDVRGHTVILAPSEGDVIFAYFAPKMGRRWYHFFKPGEHRHQTEESLRRLTSE